MSEVHMIQLEIYTGADVPNVNAWIADRPGDLCTAEGMVEYLPGDAIVYAIGSLHGRVMPSEEFYATYSLRAQIVTDERHVPNYHQSPNNRTDTVQITSDDPDEEGVIHRYSAILCYADGEAYGPVIHVQFQQGARGAHGTMPGCTEVAIYAIMVDRLKGIQKGPHPSQANQDQIRLLEECIALTLSSVGRGSADVP